MEPEAEVARGFSGEFLAVDLETQISHCDKYEILPEMMSCLPANRPILEAGAGSGRWVVYFRRKGYKIIGIDWSNELCEYARSVEPSIDMRQGDLRSLPFEDEMFGGVLALGSVEHTQEGPARIFREFNRCLGRDGVALITVPYYSPLRRIILPCKSTARSLRASAVLRRLFGKPPLEKSAINLKSVLNNSLHGVWTDVDMQTLGWYFYQYRFDKDQIRARIEEAGFRVERIWLAFAAEGIIQDLGKLGGRFDYGKGRANLSFLGALVLKAIPHWFSLMVCVVARKAT